MTSRHAFRAISDLQAGDHACCLYESEEEHRALLTPYLRQGLERGEKVVYIVDARTAETVVGYLRDDGVQVEIYLRSGQLSILTVKEAYLRDGAFSPDGMIALLGDETKRALEEGYTAFRVTGEMTWALQGVPGSERLMEYESNLNDFFVDSKAIGLCQYDRRRFDPAILLGALATHPIAVVGPEIYDNFYYISPAVFRGQDRTATVLLHRLETLKARSLVEVERDRLFREQTLRRNRSEALNAISMTINSTLDSDEIMERVVGAAATAIGCESAGIVLRDGEHWIIRYIYRMPEGIVGTRIGGEEATHIALAASAKELLAIDDALNDNRVKREAMEAYGLRSVLMVPLVAKDETIGVLSFNYHSAAVPFSDADMDFARDLGLALSFAVENARLYSAERGARKEAEAARRQVSDILESVTDAFFALDRQWRITYVNKAAEPLMRKTREELLGKNLWDEFPEAVGSTFYNEYHRVMSDQVPRRFEEYYPPFETWFEVHAYPRRDGVAVYFQDISARKRAEDDLRKLSRAVEQSPSTVVITDIWGHIEYVNPKFVQTTGYTLEEAIGQNPRILKSGEMPSEGYQKLWETISSGGEWRGELHNKKKDGELYWEFASISSIRDPAGNTTHYLAVKEDITARKQAEEEKERLMGEAQRRAVDLDAVNKELEAFSYSVSHDLRAPLRSIDGFSQVLLRNYVDKLDDKGQDYLERVRAASQRMGHLIDDMLMLSRVTRKEMRRESVDLSRLARDIARELQEAEKERRVEFLITPGLTVQGDPDLLRLALQNLFGNAWKFTSTHASATIEFGVTQHEGKPAYFVRDDGAGFDMAYSDKLFGAFQRLHRVTEFPGSGIGLATVQRIVHRHGGRVWAEGAMENGATFYFTL